MPTTLLSPYEERETVFQAQVQPQLIALKPNYQHNTVPSRYPTLMPLHLHQATAQPATSLALPHYSLISASIPNQYFRAYIYPSSPRSSVTAAI